MACRFQMCAAACMQMHGCTSADACDPSMRQLVIALATAHLHLLPCGTMRCVMQAMKSRGCSIYKNELAKLLKLAVSKGAAAHRPRVLQPACAAMTPRRCCCSWVLIVLGRSGALPAAATIGPCMLCAAAGRQRRRRAGLHRVHRRDPPGAPAAGGGLADGCVQGAGRGAGERAALVPRCWALGAPAGDSPFPGRVGERMCVARQVAR